MKKKVTIIGGLNNTPQDDRDLLLGSIFRLIDIKDVPNEDFVVSVPLKIKDQGDTDLCSAFAVTSVSEDQEGILLSPEYQFAKTKQLMGDWSKWGADLRVACKSAVHFGSIPGIISPFTLDTKMRDYIANWHNWPQKIDANAHKYAKDSFLKITGPYDHFDNIRATLWQFKDEKRSIVTGATWKDLWIYVDGGVIPEDDYEGGFGHAFKIFGQKMIEGTPYLVAQLSNGVDIGSDGLFYFPRKIINDNVEKYKAFMFKDISPEKARFLQENNLTTSSSSLEKFIIKIIVFIKNIWKA